MAIDIASLIKPASVISEHLKICIYGEYSCGKTTLVANSPRPLLVDTERGATALVKNELLKDTPTIRIKTLPEFMDLFDFLKSPGGNDYDTIIVDTFSELAKQFLDSIVQDSAAANPKMDNYTIPDGGYNRNNQYLRYFIGNLMTLPKHVILTAHAQTLMVNGIDKKIPLFTPKVLEGVMGLMDVVGYMRVVEVPDTDSPNPTARKKVRVIQTLQTPTTEAKNRLDVPDIIENPTMQVFFDAHTKRMNEARQNNTLRQEQPVEPDKLPTTKSTLGLNI